ncbi:MAG: ABC transporter ATP-binding protein [Chloroflexia bacterium]
MSNFAIRVEGVGKRYRMGQVQHRKMLRESLTRAATAPSSPADCKTWRDSVRPGGRGRDKNEFALKDVSLDIRHGEAVGVIGRNGAGKSTMLKLLSRITKPTTGSITLHGRVGSLLEVGTGFHSELTGRENIYLNGAILGMGRAEIRRKLDQIVAFSEIEDFINTPVKYYSSGMYTRLAFSVAAHLEPDILVVDEVLAVGDAAFQKKCLGRMQDVAREGRTVLFVSHNMLAIQSLCQRAVWLEAGEVAADGEANTVVGAYLRQAFTGLSEQRWDDVETAPGNDYVRLHRVRVLPLEGAEAAPTVRTPFTIEFEY